MFVPDKGKAGGRRRGMTLIEVLVASAIMVVVMGLILGLLIQTRRATIDGQNRLAMVSEAELVAEEIVSVLQAAVPPGALDAASTTASLSFAAAQCSLVSSRGFDGKNFYVFTISNGTADRKTEDESEKNLSVVMLSTRAFDSARMAPVVREETRRLGLSEGRFSTSVSFEYAADAAGGALNMALSPQLPAGRYPSLVQARVLVRDGRGELAPYELIVAVRM